MASDYCKKCQKNVALDEILIKIAGGRIQIKGTCKHCNSWIKWVSRRDSNIVENLLQEHIKK